MTQGSQSVAGGFDLVPYSLIALLARVVTGLVFFRSGLTKIDLATFSLKPSTFFLFDQEYKFRLLKYLGLPASEPAFPNPHGLAYIATAFELILPLVVWLGFGTRLAACLLLAQTLVIETVYPDAYIEHGFWAIALLMLMRFGPGQLSVDRLMRRTQAASLAWSKSAVE